MLGILTFLDPPRPDTKVTIENAKKFGVDVKMVTGDHVLIAKEMARMLNMGTNIQTAQGLPHFPESGDPKDIPDTLGDEYGDMIAAMDGFAQVHPEHKYLIVETLRQRGFTCAMTGDGVNDAPALKRADVGIAVHGSTDAARAASDMVLTEPGLSVIVDAMLIARGVFQRMLSFLTYRVSATLQLVFFFFIAVFALPPKDYGAVDPSHPEEAEFFHLPVLMFMLITLLNDGTLMAIGYDNVVPQPRPQRWNLRALFFIAAVLAGVACVSSLWLLWMMLDSIRDYENSWFFNMGLPPADYPHIISAIYLKVSISDFLTLFAARTQTKPFFAYAPSKVLFFGAVGSLLISSFVGAFWPRSSPGWHLDGRLGTAERGAAEHGVAAPDAAVRVDVLRGVVVPAGLDQGAGLRRDGEAQHLLVPHLHGPRHPRRHADRRRRQPPAAGHQPSFWRKGRLWRVDTIIRWFLLATIRNNL
jgi:H+-transporting ATPase